MWVRMFILWWVIVAVCGVDDGQIYFPDDDIFKNQQPQALGKPRPLPLASVDQNPLPQISEKPKPKPPTQSSQRPRPLPPTTNGKSAQMCKEYAESVYYKTEGFNGEIVKIDTCMLIEPLIVNGTAAQPREFPHMALIGVNTVLGIQWKCGGSLISKRFVLSAAHCNPLGPKVVRLGDYNHTSKKDDEDNTARPEDYNIIEVFEHPAYVAVKEYNDITLYKLDRDVVFNEYIRPICLHTKYELPRGFGIISGWGRTEYGGRASDVLQKGNVSYVPANECASTLNPILLGGRQSEIRNEMMICAGNFKKGTDTCQGDSGGPLQYRLKEPYCMYSQVGITSIGIRCGYVEGEPKYPGIYTRVSNYVPWIESIVWP